MVVGRQSPFLLGQMAYFQGLWLLVLEPERTSCTPNLTQKNSPTACPLKSESSSYHHFLCRDFLSFLPAQKSTFARDPSTKKMRDVFFIQNLTICWVGGLHLPQRFRVNSKKKLNETLSD